MNTFYRYEFLYKEYLYHSCKKYFELNSLYKIINPNNIINYSVLYTSDVKGGYKLNQPKFIIKYKVDHNTKCKFISNKDYILQYLQNFNYVNSLKNQGIKIICINKSFVNQNENIYAVIDVSCLTENYCEIL